MQLYTITHIDTGICGNFAILKKPNGSKKKGFGIHVK